MCADFNTCVKLANVHINCTQTQTPNTQNTHKTPAPSPVKAAAYRLRWRVTQVPLHTSSYSDPLNLTLTHSYRRTSQPYTHTLLPPHTPNLSTLHLGMHRYHFFTNRYEYEYFYLCTCRYRVPILLRFGLHESAINLEADFILSSADYVKPIVQNEQKAIPSQK